MVGGWVPVQGVEQRYETHAYANNAALPRDPRNRANVPPKQKGSPAKPQPRIDAPKPTFDFFWCRRPSCAT